jgi:ribose transport system substrate-binding protein
MGVNYRRHAAVLSALTGLVVAATACSSSGGSGSTGSSAGTSGQVTAMQQASQKYLAKPATIPQTVALPSKPPSGKSVIFLFDGLSATARIAAGVQAAAKAIGWSYSELSYDPANPATLQQAALNALAKKPTVVAEAGSPQSQFGTSTLAAYKRAGIPIVLGSVAPVQLGDPIYGTPAGQASEVNVGTELADWFVANSGGKGQALLENYTSAPVLNVFRDAFIAEVKAHCPACKTKVVPVTQANVDAGSLVSTVVSAARSNPSYKYIFFDNGQFGDGVLSALAAAGLTGMTIGGRSIDPYGEAALKAGKEQVWTGQSYFLQGEGIIDVALRVLMKAPGVTNDDVIPTQLITKQNVSEITGQFYDFPVNSLQQYEKLWHVPATGASG